jgi:Transcription factor WhiB
MSDRDLLEAIWGGVRQPHMRNAACKEEPWLPWVPDFSGPREERPREVDLKKMRAICSDCEHLIECRDFALSSPTVLGMWGGLTYAERRAARVGRRAS